MASSRSESTNQPAHLSIVPREADAPEAPHYFFRALFWAFMAVASLVGIALLFTLVFTHAPTLVPVVIGLATVTLFVMLTHDNRDRYRLFNRIDQRVAEYARLDCKTSSWVLLTDKAVNKITPEDTLALQERRDRLVALREHYTPAQFRAFLKAHTNAGKENIYKEGTCFATHCRNLDGWWINPDLHMSHRDWEHDLLKTGAQQARDPNSVVYALRIEEVKAAPVGADVGQPVSFEGEYAFDGGVFNRSNPTPTDYSDPHRSDPDTATSVAARLGAVPVSVAASAPAPSTPPRRSDRSGHTTPPTEPADCGMVPVVSQPVTPEKGAAELGLMAHDRTTPTKRSLFDSHTSGAPIAAHG